MYASFRIRQAYRERPQVGRFLPVYFHESKPLSGALKMHCLRPIAAFALNQPDLSSPRGRYEMPWGAVVQETQSPYNT